jgi:hypothetical protein
MDLYFQALTHADAVVALAACSALTSSMDGLDIASGQSNLAAFLPVLPVVVEQLVELLHALEEEDSKSNILHSMSITISHSGESAAQLATGLIAALPQIRNASRNCLATQPKFLVLATVLVNCARVAVAPRVSALCSTIAFFVNVSDALTLTTREFDLDTFLAIMRNITACTEELHKLFEILVPFIHEDPCDKTVVRILDSLFLLGVATFASVYSDVVLQCCARLLPYVNDSVMILISQSVHVMFAAVPGVVGRESAGAMCAAIASFVTQTKLQ